MDPAMAPTTTATAAAASARATEGISITNKTDDNSTSLVLTIGENFITQW